MLRGAGVLPAGMVSVVVLVGRLAAWCDEQGKKWGEIPP